MRIFNYVYKKLRIGKLPAFVRNKYTITFLIFLVWMLFFDHNNIIAQFQLQAKLDRLQEQKVFYQRKIKEIKASKKELLRDEDKLERFARERYWMKRPNEDLYIIKEANKD